MTSHPRLNLVESGDGAPFVFQHGLCGDAAQAGEVFPTDMPLRRMTLECRGHGLSEPGDASLFSIATFADDGPKRCTGLDVCRYNAETMGTELGEGFSLVRDARETHTTPWGSSQAFFYGVFRRQ